ncbi:hypothetical protein B0H63DRAFT_186496 [Podospora didyma]|uniref:Uncharacterized protein n=1 Tax=Podospora didyma TaxID=330526 RepID=A0AAE0NQ98_9PEZI|nr:hypothetical protein B0H63DRAFT_186496 [Podospora didyma]
MMDKCWFILRHADITPPEIAKSGVVKGPLCLGHLVPSPKRILEVINTNGPESVPPDMPILPAKAVNFSWEQETGRSFTQGAGVEVPIAAAVAPGVTVGARASAAFQKTVSEHWQFDALETFTFHPTREYIEDSLDNELVKGFVSMNKKKLTNSWHVFMVTGVKIARGARMTSSRARLNQADGGADLSASGIFSFSGNTGISSESRVTMSQDAMSDFVWAVRLAKISKGVFDRTWSHSTHYSEGAAFGLEGPSRTAPIELLRGADCDLGDEEIFELDGGDFAVCI